ncbi:hypothetical protein [Hydrocarboniphaga sp.]|uniref:hypothetical protein n=1 Tax=Hydrocarboniphaga sp. TaxID=2033016 RepID=UPI003D0E65E8
MRAALLRFACLLLTAGSSCSAASAAAPRSYIPGDDSVVLESLPVRRDPAVRALRSERALLAASPRDPAIAAAYARRAIELGRTQSDPRFYGYAAAALSPWDADAKAPVEIDWLRSVLQQQRHDFTGAMSALDALLQRENYPPAHLTRASLLMVQGRPREALRDCAALARSNLVTATSCAASASSLSGRAAAALASVDSIIPRLTGASLDERLWTLTLAAELAARLERDDAPQRYDAALAELDASNSGDAYLLAAYADYELDRQRPQPVIARLRDQQRVDTLLLRLTLAEQQLQAAGTPQADFDAHRRELISRFDAVRARGETTHGREETMFVLRIEQDPARALLLAQSNWQVQREPVDARLLLEAALAARQPAAAAPVLEWMRATTIEDPLLHRLAEQLGAAS